MPAAALPPDENERLRALQRYAILDTLPEEQYDDITLLASQICDAPISAITLVDRDRQWFKSIVGLESQETPRDVSFCAHAILGNELLEVCDASLDARFSDNPLVKEAPSIRFYAGAPLMTPDGFAVGALCVAGSQPRKLSPQQHRALEALARQVMTLLELRRAVARLEVADRARAQAMDHLISNSLILRQFVQHAPASIAMLDCNLRYLAVSQRFLRDNEINSLDLTGQSHLHLFPALPASWLEAYEKALAGETTHCWCEEVRRAGGETGFIRWEVLPWHTSDGAIGGIITLTEDITARVRAERLKSDFVSVVSHELRTPLTSIRGALGLLANGVAGELPVRAGEMVSIAQKNSERLLLLINDLLDIDKIESGLMPFDFSVLDLQELLANALESNHPYAERLGVKLEGQPLPAAISTAGRSVHGDAGRLQQVLTNLLSNAAKFTPCGGRVCLSARHWEGQGRHWVRIEVQDEGEGVPAEFESQMFERFAQADSSATRQKGGTGLGLAIARAIIEKHGGRIGYKPPTPAQKGATFFFDLPFLIEADEQ